jgi:hypothetical protein
VSLGENAGVESMAGPRPQGARVHADPADAGHRGKGGHSRRHVHLLLPSFNVLTAVAVTERRGSNWRRPTGEAQTVLHCHYISQFQFV